jgi:hypothetical protein
MIARIEHATRGQDWRWACGIYPGVHLDENKTGTAGSFDQARERWQAAWERFLSRRRPEEFEEYRQHLRFAADKLAGRMPAPDDGSRMRFARGADFDNHDSVQVREHARHVDLAKRAKIGGW